MLAFLKSTWDLLARSSEARGMEATRRQLLDLDDRTLADIGVSRTMLELGPDAWPWRLDAQDAADADADPRAAGHAGEDATVPNPAAEVHAPLDRAA